MGSLGFSAHITIGDTLTHLLQYYHVQGHQLGGDPHTPIKTASRAPGPTRAREHDSHLPALRVAVDSHPERAHRALAMELGLDYDKVQANMEPVREERPSTIMSDGQPSQSRKRRRGDSATDTPAQETSPGPESSRPALRSTRRKTRI